jgi:hypothetical protein
MRHIYKRFFSKTTKLCEKKKNRQKIQKGYIKLNYVVCLSGTGSFCHVTVMGSLIVLVNKRADWNVPVSYIGSLFLVLASLKANFNIFYEFITQSLFADLRFVSIYLWQNKRIGENEPSLMRHIYKRLIVKWKLLQIICLHNPLNFMAPYPVTFCAFS